jgi:hypothetical protein
VKRLRADDSAATSVKVGNRQACIRKAPGRNAGGFLLCRVALSLVDGGQKPRKYGGMKLILSKFVLLQKPGPVGMLFPQWLPTAVQGLGQLGGVNYLDRSASIILAGEARRF